MLKNHWWLQLEAQEEETMRSLARKEISLDAAVTAVLIRTGGVFTLKEEHKNDTEGFSLQTTLFCLVLPARIALNVTVASHKAANVMYGNQSDWFCLNVTDG